MKKYSLFSTFIAASIFLLSISAEEINVTTDPVAESDVKDFEFSSVSEEVDDFVQVSVSAFVSPPAEEIQMSCDSESSSCSQYRSSGVLKSRPMQRIRKLFSR